MRLLLKKPVISFKNFSFQYFSQAQPTLTDITLDIYEGEKVLIAGPSGSGKSTLGHCINGLIPFAYKGEITGALFVNGVDTTALDIFQLSKSVGTVLQDSDGQFVGLIAGEDIAFVLENNCVPRAEMIERVKRSAVLVGMDAFLDSSPFELSGGQKQRTALAGVMVNEVDILLFDEPLANLDPATGKTAIEIIDDIYKNSGKTVVIIEHRLEDVLHRPVDRIIVMDDGRIFADMPPDELLSTGILKEKGIREPLYITAAKYAGIKITAQMKPAHIETIEIAPNAGQLEAWSKSIKREMSVKRPESALRMEGINFSYDEKRQALIDISFNITKGEMVSIVGKNGAGKSTIARLVCGFEKEDSGAIYVDGENIKDMTIKERAGKAGLIMQNPNQMISQPLIADEVGLGLMLAGIGQAERERRVKDVLELCGLKPFINWPVSALSYGQKKRVTIASMLVMEPSVLMLDEPTAGQDYRHYTEIMEFLRKLNKNGMTVILITHDMHLMLEYTPRAIVLADGRIIADSSAADILTNEAVIRKANLKETSLYTLATRAGISDAEGFVNSFIDYEKTVK